MNANETAWSAGLFEGEGSIGIRPPRPRYPHESIRLQLGMTDRDVVERLRDVVVVGKVSRRRPPSHQPHYKTQWIWATADREEVRRLLEAWLPWLGKRRATKAHEALAILDRIEELRQRVCWCGKSFRAERNTKRACCERHAQILYNRTHAEKIKAQRRARYLKGRT